MITPDNLAVTSEKMPGLMGLEPQLVIGGEATSALVDHRLFAPAIRCRSSCSVVRSARKVLILV